MKTLCLWMPRDLSKLGHKGRYDFYISGKPLSVKIERRGYVDYVCRAGFHLDQQTRDALLLEEVDDELPPDWIGLYAFGYGWDPGANMIAVRAARDNDDIVWSDFRYVTPGAFGSPNFEGNFAEFSEGKPLEKLGPFRFDYEQYRKAILDKETGGYEALFGSR